MLEAANASRLGASKLSVLQARNRPGPTALQTQHQPLHSKRNNAHVAGQQRRENTAPVKRCETKAAGQS